jgi:hypothetical protein
MLPAQSPPCTGKIIPAQLLAVPAYDPDAYPLKPPPLPTATVTPAGTLYLSKAFARTLHLRSGQPIDLVPPPPGEVYWHLDLRHEAARRLDWSGSVSTQRRGQSPRVKNVLPAQFVQQSLTLVLLPGEPQRKDYYPLLPPDAFTPVR